MKDYNANNYPNFIRVKPEDVTLKFVFDNIRNIGLSALAFAAGILIIKNEPLSTLLSIPYSQFLIGGLLCAGAFIIAILNFAQAIIAIQAISKMGKVPYIILALLLNVATFELFFRKVIEVTSN